MDADDTHPPAVIPSLLAALDAGADVAVASATSLPAHACTASRAAPPADPTPRRSSCTSPRRWRACATSPAASAPTASPPSARAGARYDHLVEADGFACMLDLLLKLDAVSATITEVPIDLRYDRKRGASKLRVDGR